MKKHLLTIVAIGAATLQANAASNIGYLSGTSEPWNLPDLPLAMDAAFGGGNWDRHVFGTFGAGDLANLDFLYIDGGDGMSGQFNAYMSANISALEAWVAQGNCLLVNAARWEGGEDFWGFNTWVIYDPGAFSTTGWAADPLHPLFDAGTGTAWTGNFFSHDVVFDTLLTPVIEGQSGPVLVEGAWGAGHVMLGTMTSPFYQDPDPNAFNLRVNLLEYAAQDCLDGGHEPVPEVQHYAAMLGAAMAGVEMLRRRRKA